MADLDIRKAADSIGELLAAYIDRFVAILSRPRPAFRGLVEETETAESHRFRNAVAYAATSILLGLCLARFVELPESPKEVDPRTAIAVLLVWVLSALVLHPCLKVFRAKGTIAGTLVVFLYSVSTLHLLFIPALALIGHIVTETQVVLTYNYVVYFGAPTRGEYGWGSDTGVAEYAYRDWGDVTRLREIRTESYVKEREPNKEGTILPPAPSKESSRAAADVPTSPNDRPRVALSASTLDPPKRTETLIIGERYGSLLLGFWMLYYLVNSAYLAIGLGTAHRMNRIFLFGLAVFGPPALVATAGVLLLVAIVVHGL